MMKNLLIILAPAILFASCGGNSGNTEKSQDSITSRTLTTVVDSSKIKADSTANSGAIKHVSIATSSDPGADLIVKNDCRNCHREREKLVGPAFSDIAKRYKPGDVDSLAAKIIRGGSGHWGDAAMSAHPSLSPADAKTIVKFILTIN